MSQTIAILGASTDRKKFGNKCVRAYTSAGWRVFPVHPTAKEIEGLAAYAQLSEIPEELDRVSVYLPPAVGLELLPAIAAKAPRELWLNPGASDETLLRRAAELGIHTIAACSIVDIGLSPSDFPG